MSRNSVSSSQRSLPTTTPSHRYNNYNSSSGGGGGRRLTIYERSLQMLEEKERRMAAMREQLHMAECTFQPNTKRYAVPGQRSDRTPVNHKYASSSPSSPPPSSSSSLYSSSRGESVFERLYRDGVSKYGSPASTTTTMYSSPGGFSSSSNSHRSPPPSSSSKNVKKRLLF